MYLYIFPSPLIIPSMVFYHSTGRALDLFLSFIHLDYIDWWPVYLGLFVCSLGNDGENICPTRLDPISITTYHGSVRSPTRPSSFDKVR